MPGCKARVAINATAASGPLIEHKPTTVIIYDRGTPVHSCDLEPARGSAERADKDQGEVSGS